MQIYTRPTYEFFEIMFARHNEGPISLWNCTMRFFITTTYVVILTLICCMVPFFIDFVALVGALGFTPLDFVLPVLLYMVANKATVSFWWTAANSLLAVIYCVVAVLGAVGAFYFIIQHAIEYKLFADL